MRALRSFGTCLATVLVAAGSLLASAGTAHALTVDQTCTGTWAVSFNPPITNTPQLVTGTLSGILPSCTDREASNGSHFETFTDTVSCATLLNAGSTSRTFVWGNPAAEASTFTYNWTVTDIGGQVVVTSVGLITSGKFAPDSAVQVTTLVTPDAAQCAGSGVATVTGPTTLTIYHL